MIRLSPLKLSRYVVEELHVGAKALQLSAPTPVPDLTPEDLDVQVEYFQNEADVHDLLCRLVVKSKETDKPVPYRFMIRLSGQFRLAVETLNPEQQAAHIRFSMPSLLWAAAREVLATQMARGPYPAVTLPVVTFMPESVQAGTSGSEPQGAAHAKEAPADVPPVHGERGPAMSMKEPGLDNRYRDQHQPKTGEIRLKRGDTLNKNLSQPIAEFSGNAKLSTMRAETGKVGINAVRKAAKKVR